MSQYDMDWEREHSGGEITSTEPAKFFGGCCNGGYFVPLQLATDLIGVTNILRDHLFITGEFGASLALYFDIKAVLKQRLRP